MVRTETIALLDSISAVFSLLVEAHPAASKADRPATESMALRTIIILDFSHAMEAGSMRNRF